MTNPSIGQSKIGTCKSKGLSTAPLWLLISGEPGNLGIQDSMILQGLFSGVHIM